MIIFKVLKMLACTTPFERRVIEMEFKAHSMLDEKRKDHRISHGLV
jgi:hypothetical protein